MVGLRCIILLAVLALALDALLVHGFVPSHHNVAHTRTFVNKQSFQQNLPLCSKGNEDDTASLDFSDQALAASVSSAAESFNLTLADPSSSSFVNQSGDTSILNDNSFFSSRTVIAVVSVATLLALSQLPQIRVLATAIITTYSKLIAEYPLPTKSLTSGALCGVSDVIAQFREANRKQFNFKRWIRFAGKSLSTPRRFLNNINIYTHPSSVICYHTPFWSNLPTQIVPSCGC